MRYFNKSQPELLEIDFYFFEWKEDQEITEFTELFGFSFFL